MSFPGHYECIKELVWGAFQPNDLSRQFTTPCLESRQQAQQANIATPSCNCFSVVADRLWMWWRLSRTGCECGGGCQRQAVDVMEVVRDRLWWSSQTGCECGGGRHGQAVDVVEVVRDRLWWRSSETWCECGGGRHGQDVDVVEVVRDRLWRSSQTSCGCGGGRHRQDVNVVEVVTDRMWIWWRSSLSGMIS